MKEAVGSLRRTPLNPVFREMGARLVDFTGWEMPVQFSSLLEEHRAVRSAAGLFDASHMGEIEVSGPDALALVQTVTCNDAGRLRAGGAQYTVLTTERGTCIDDVIVYCRAPDRFMLVPNASNTDKDFAWLVHHAKGDVEVVNASGRWAQIAIQGPRAQSILQEVTAVDLGSIRYFNFAEGEVRRGAPALISRTGYTGEDGFEIYLAPEDAPDFYRTLLRVGQGKKMLPCGLGARDTLRLEARMMLYGNDIDETTTVLEAGLRGIVRLDKGEFIGRAALQRQEREGVRRILIGFEMIDRRIARHGHTVRHDGRDIGRVTSGTFAPHLRKNIGLAYVPAHLAVEGTRLSVVIREQEAAAVVVTTPFYRRPC